MQKRFFHENGYLILPALISSAMVRKLKDHFDELWDQRSRPSEVAIDVFFNLPGEARLYFSKAPSEARGSPYKILDLHLVDTAIGQACTDPGIVSALQNLLGANPLVCNSLLFEWGSQQYPHFDTFFMPSATPNMMAAAWIALDRVTDANGPLYYYPRSHLIEPYRFSDGRINAIFSELKTGAADHIDRIIEQHGLVKEIFMPNPGDVLIWHAQLLHGGSPSSIPPNAGGRSSRITGPTSIFPTKIRGSTSGRAAGCCASRTSSSSTRTCCSPSTPFSPPCRSRRNWKRACQTRSTHASISLATRTSVRQGKAPGATTSTTAAAKAASGSHVERHHAARRSLDPIGAGLGVPGDLGVQMFGS